MRARRDDQRAHFSQGRPAILVFRKNFFPGTALAIDHSRTVAVTLKGFDPIRRCLYLKPPQGLHVNLNPEARFARERDLAVHDLELVRDELLPQN